MVYLVPITNVVKYQNLYQLSIDNQCIDIFNTLTNLNNEYLIPINDYIESLSIVLSSCNIINEIYIDIRMITCNNITENLLFIWISLFILSIFMLFKQFSSSKDNYQIKNNVKENIYIEIPDL